MTILTCQSVPLPRVLRAQPSHLCTPRPEQVPAAAQVATSTAISRVTRRSAPHECLDGHGRCGQPGAGCGAALRGIHWQCDAPACVRAQHPLHRDPRRQPASTRRAAGEGDPEGSRAHQSRPARGQLRESIGLDRKCEAGHHPARLRAGHEPVILSGGLRQARAQFGSRAGFAGRVRTDRQPGAGARGAGRQRTTRAGLSLRTVQQPR